MRKWIPAMILFLAVVLGLVLGYLQSQPPAVPAGLDETPVTLAEAAEGPDLKLMLTHIREMAGEVHSVGSPGLARTHAYLKSQLEAMGYVYTVDSYQLTMEEVQALLIMRSQYHGYTDQSTLEEIRDRAGLGQQDLMPLHNILVHLDAPGTEETIIFMAHTDSVIQGPGAFDDTVSVAALLEGLRAVQGREIARDLLFLFTDGEEQGLLGAAKFIEDHPEYLDRTRLVVNLEARGNAGVLILFQTTDNNLGLMENYRQAVEHPFSTSIATDVYKTMPNDTDLTHFIQAGYPGINLAVIDGSHVYHTEMDNYDTFSRDSARHYLDTTVGLVTHLALMPELHLETGQDAVHFPFLPGKLAILPVSLANLLAYAAFVLTLVCLFSLLWKKCIRLPGLLLTMGAQIAILVLSAGLTWAIIEGMYLLNDRYGWFQGMLRGTQSHVLLLLLLALFILCAAGLFWLIWCRNRRQQPAADRFSRLLGVLLLPALLGVLCTGSLPGGSYLFSLPVLACVLILMADRLYPPLATLLSALSVVLILLLYVPLISLLHTALHIYTARVTLPVAMIPVTLLAGIGGFICAQPGAGHRESVSIYQSQQPQDNA
jgi:hypothetical protein